MFTPAEFGKVSVLVPANGGAVPYGNTVVVHGSESTLVIDPSLSLDRDPVGADLVFVSHGHEDHIAGLRHFDTPGLCAPSRRTRSRIPRHDAHQLRPSSERTSRGPAVDCYAIRHTPPDPRGRVGGSRAATSSTSATALRQSFICQGTPADTAGGSSSNQTASSTLPTSTSPPSARCTATWVAASTTSSTPSTTSQRSTHAGTEHSIRRAWSRAATSSVAGCPHTATNY